MFDAAVARAMPDKCVPPFLPSRRAAARWWWVRARRRRPWPRAVEDNWPGKLTGLVVTRYGHHAPCQRVEVVEAAHPVPDPAGQQAAQRILRMVQGLSADDLVLCLISGGGSALLSLPAPGLTLQNKQAINRALLKSGANIAEMNCVRKHLSAIKGGRLAAACHPAKVVTLTISDVPGDDPAVIASGPTVPDRTTFADALGILDKYGIAEPKAAWSIACSAGRDPQARRSTPGGDRNPSHRRAPTISRGRGRGGSRRVSPRDPGRQPGGRVARSGDGACGYRPPGRYATASRPKRRACCYRVARPRLRYAATGAAGATSSFCWPSRWRWTGTKAHLRAGGRHRWGGRDGRQCRSRGYSRYARPRSRKWSGREIAPCR